MVDKDVVAISPQPRLAAQEVPDQVQRRSPRRANLIRLNLAPDGSQLARLHGLHLDGDGHLSILDQEVCCPKDLHRTGTRTQGFIPLLDRAGSHPHLPGWSILEWAPSTRWSPAMPTEKTPVLLTPMGTRLRQKRST